MIPTRLQPITTSATQRLQRLSSSLRLDVRASPTLKIRQLAIALLILRSDSMSFQQVSSSQSGSGTSSSNQNCRATDGYSQVSVFAAAASAMCVVNSLVSAIKKGCNQRCSGACPCGGSDTIRIRKRYNANRAKRQMPNTRTAIGSFGSIAHSCNKNRCPLHV